MITIGILGELDEWKVLGDQLGLLMGQSRRFELAIHGEDVNRILDYVIFEALCYPHMMTRFCKTEADLFHVADVVFAFRRPSDQPFGPLIIPCWRD